VQLLHNIEIGMPYYRTVGVTVNMKFLKGVAQFQPIFQVEGDHPQQPLLELKQET